MIISGFLDLSTIEIWGQVILSGRGCPEHFRVFSSISGLDPLNASSTPFTVMTIKNVSGYCYISLGAQSCTQLRAPGLDHIKINEEPPYPIRFCERCSLDKNIFKLFWFMQLRGAILYSPSARNKVYLQNSFSFPFRIPLYFSPIK